MEAEEAARGGGMSEHLQDLRGDDCSVLSGSFLKGLTEFVGSR